MKSYIVNLNQHLKWQFLKENEVLNVLTLREFNEHLDRLKNLDLSSTKFVAINLWCKYNFEIAPMFIPLFLQGICIIILK